MSDTQPKKVVFVSHPVAGDVAGNVTKVLAICRDLHMNGIIPFAPYIVALQYLSDADPEERSLGVQAVNTHFERHSFDEVWLYGERISDGMKAEILLARKYDIPVVPKTPETEKALREMDAS